MSTFIKHIDKILIFLLCWIPYFIYIYHSSSGIPFNDDYDMFLRSLIKVKEANGLNELISVIFSQHMEHRPAVPRLVAALVWKTYGSCDLKILMLIGNGMLFGIWVIVTNVFSPESFFRKLIWAITTFFILASLQSMENQVWATGALQNYSFVFFTLLAIYFTWMGKPIIGIGFWLGSILCTITGFVVAPLLLTIHLRNGNLKTWIISLFIVSVTSFLYFKNLSFPPVEKLPGIIPHYSLLSRVQYFLAFLGSTFTLGRSTLDLSLLFGALLGIITIYLNRRLLKWNLASMISIFVILVAVTGVLFRGVLGPHQALADRYKIYSQLLMICCLFGILQFPRAKMAGMISVLFIVIFGMQFWFQYQFNHSKIIRRKEELNYGYIQLVTFKNPFGLTYPSSPEGASLMIRAYELKIFAPPKD